MEPSASDYIYWIKITQIFFHNFFLQKQTSKLILMIKSIWESHNQLTMKRYGLYSTEERLCETEGRKQPLTTQGERPQGGKKSTRPKPWTSSFLNGEKINLCSLIHMVCGICYDNPSKLIQWAPWMPENTQSSLRLTEL